MLGDTHRGVWKFQYMGSRGAQLRRSSTRNSLACFNTWAREEPNFPSSRKACIRSSFNTWAREEPNLDVKLFSAIRDVSIHGLARSPTAAIWSLLYGYRFQYMGSRGAQQQADRMRGLSLKVSIHGLARSPTGGTVNWKKRRRFQYMGSRGAQLPGLGTVCP